MKNAGRMSAVLPLCKTKQVRSKRAETPQRGSMRARHYIHVLCHAKLDVSESLGRFEIDSRDFHASRERVLDAIGLPIPTKYLEFEELFKEELLLVLPPDHPLAEKPRIRLSDVKPFPFVLLHAADPTLFRWTLHSL